VHALCHTLTALVFDYFICLLFSRGFMLFYEGLYGMCDMRDIIGVQLTLAPCIVHGCLAY